MTLRPRFRGLSCRGGRTLCAVLVAVALASGAAASAEEAAAGGQAAAERFPQALGLYSDISGIVGLCYQSWSGNLGWEAALSLAFSEGNQANAAVIGELRYRLSASAYSSWLSGTLYVAALGGLAFQSVNLIVGDSPPAAPFSLLGGAGIGIETTYFGHFSQDMQFFYRLAYNNGNIAVWLCPGYAVMYRF